MVDNEHAIDAVDVAAIGIILALVYVWFRLTGKAAEKMVPAVMHIVRPTVRSVIERAEQITREAVDTAGKDSS